MYSVYNQRGELEKSGFSSYEGAATFCISRGKYGNWQIKQVKYETKRTRKTLFI